MAPTYGSAKGSPNKFRVGIELTIPTPSVTDTSVTVTTRVYLWTRTAVNESARVFLSGSASMATTEAGSIFTANTPSGSAWSDRNKQLIRTSTRTIAVSGVDQTLDSTASITALDSAGHSTTASVTVKGVLKKSPLAKPDAPTGVNRTRNSDTSITVTWTNTNPTASTKKYQGLVLQRWDNVTNKWYDLKRLGVVSSYTDTTVQEDREYQYRVQSYNTGGFSLWATSAKVQTSPLSPYLVTETRPASVVTVSWKCDSTIVASFKIRHYEDGVDLGIVASGLAAGARSWAHSGLSEDVEHAYRVIAVANLESAPSALSVGLPKKGQPYAPRDLEPDGVTLSVADPIRFSWRHSSPDGGNQVARALFLREAGTEANLFPSDTRRTLTGPAYAATDQISLTGHYLNTGYPVKITGGTPPAPLAIGLTYYAIVDSPTLIRLALDESDAEDRIAISLTTSVGGVTCEVPTAMSNEQAYILPADLLTPGKVYEWHSATKTGYTGVEPMSPDGPLSSFRAASVPTTTIAFPLDDDTTLSPQAMVAWAFYSADPGVRQQWWQASLWSGDTLLERREGSGETDNYTFGYRLTNGGTYRVEVMTEGSNGIASEVVSATFTPEWVDPEAALVSLSWDADDGSVELDIVNPPNLDKPAAYRITVERSIAGGAWVTIGRELPINTTVIDRLPYPNEVNNYRVTASAPGTPGTSGSTISSLASINCSNTGDWYWLNGGAGWGTLAKARYSGAVDIDLELDKELHEFAGRTRPVEYSGTIVRQEIEISAQFPRDEEGYQSMREFERLVRTPGPVYYRDPVGRRIKCSLSSVSFSDDENLINFTAQLQESD